MAKLTQVLRNSTDRPLFINLEASTSRYRLAPGEVLLLHYDPEEKFQEYTAPVVIECIDHRGEVELGPAKR